MSKTYDQREYLIGRINIGPPPEQRRQMASEDLSKVRLGAPGAGLITRTVGTCSKCRGPVGVPDVWLGTVPPVPTCGSCGAKQKSPYGPVIEME